MLRPDGYQHFIVIMQACVIGAAFVVAMMAALVAAQIATAPPFQGWGGGGSPFNDKFLII